MPCRTYEPENDVPRYNGLTAAELEAVLCGVFTVLTEMSTSDSATSPKINLIANVFDAVDWDEAGVTRRDALGWWSRHRIADNARRAREREEEARLQLREAALAKLTPVERHVLGI